MTISIEAINFNHNPLSPDSALTIRKNQVEDVAVPEWRKGMSRPEQSPAAYTINQFRNRINIEVRFRREASDAENQTVHAVAQPGNILGDIRPLTINFGLGMAIPGVVFEVHPPEIPAVGVFDIAWDWHVNGVSIGTTQHRIYTLVKEPQAPWGQPGSTFPGFQVPWTDVLDHACIQAARTRTEDDAAAKLTNWLFLLGNSKLQYDEGIGDSSFTLPAMQTFKCTEFLAHLAAGPGITKRVNCTDTATILSSFANILGCSLIQSQIGYEFDTNLIRKIGRPFPARADFNFHEVAWKFPTNGNGTRESFVYDPCLELDNDLGLTGFQPTLGIKMPLGDAVHEGYHVHLIAPGQTSPKREQSATRVRRRIDGSTTLRTVRPPEQQQRLERQHNFESWRGPATEEPEKNCKSRQNAHWSPAPASLAQEDSNSNQQLLLNHAFNLKLISPSGWKLRKVDDLKVEGDPFKLTDAIWEATDCSTAKLRVVTYECTSIAAARSFLLSLLGEFEVPSIKRRRDFIVDEEKVEIGDVAFADVEDLVVLFARGNIVLMIQNAERTTVPVSRFAYEVDKDMTKTPESEKETKQFFIPEKKFQVNERIPLKYYDGPITNEKETVFKFFAPSGQVFLAGDDLFYRPAAGGEQSITIVGLKDGAPNIRQVVNVSVDESPAIQETECGKLDKPIKEEESVMAEITGSWSLRRLTPNSDGLLDLNPDGFVQINEPDENGEITGSYADFETHTVVPVTGHVSYLAGNSFSVSLEHKLRSENTRKYEGQLVEGNADVQLVVGRFRNYTATNGTNGTNGDTNAVRALDGEQVQDGQEGGIWVATKP